MKRRRALSLKPPLRNFLEHLAIKEFMPAITFDVANCPSVPTSNCFSSSNEQFIRIGVWASLVIVKNPSISADDTDLHALVYIFSWSFNRARIFRARFFPSIYIAREITAITSGREIKRLWARTLRDRERWLDSVVTAHPKRFNGSLWTTFWDQNQIEIRADSMKKKLNSCAKTYNITRRACISWEGNC